MKTSHTRRKRLPPMRKTERVNTLRANHHLVGLFTIAAALLLLLNISLVFFPSERADATTSDNVIGWAWSSGGGWLSMNDTNSGAGGGAYGVNVNPSTQVMTGFAWSPNTGWVCVGSTCTASCPGNTPEGAASYAYVDGSGDIHGWMKFCNLGTDGWVSLNCANQSTCGTSDYNVHVNYGTGQFSGWAWHSLTSGVGWGWIDFSLVQMDTANVEDFSTNPLLCRNGLDDDLDSDFDCADSGCTFQEPACPATELNCSLIGQVDCCSNSFDDDYDGSVDCDDPNCSSAMICQPEICDNGIDDNGINGMDCDDPECFGAPGCEICDNGIEDDGDGDIDCDDSDCTTAPECTPAWLQSKFGNVYATLGIEGNAPPPGQANATYCLTSSGSITGFSSELGCEEAGESAIDLPIGPDGYASKLGQMDVSGIISGRYGEVETITNASQIDSPLAGKVYYYNNPSCSTPFILPSTTFMNATGSNSRGSGLLVINGCDLQITGNLSYQSGGVTQYLRNLASFGILVLGQYSGSTYQQGGNLYIDPSVTQIVGTVYAERSIHTGTTGDRLTDSQLEVYGALVSREILLERRWSSPTEAAEVVEFDGRGVVNPPPGFQDVAKSLPVLSDRY